MTDLFKTRSSMLIFEDVMGINSFDSHDNAKITRLKNNKNRFATLSIEEQNLILDKYKSISNQLKTTFTDKIKKIFKLLFIENSIYQLIWLILAVAIPILLLKKVEGADMAAWLLPIVVCLLIFDQPLATLQTNSSLFPTEAEIVNDYLDGHLSKNISNQKKDLSLGWQLYLAKNWSKLDQQSKIEERAEDGEFYFNLARINELKNLKPAKKRTSYVALGLYLIWNLYFAYTVAKRAYTPIPAK